MENENGNRYGTGEGQGPDYHTGNREPVIVAEQPAREVTDEDSGQASAGQDGSDGWSSPVDAPQTFLAVTKLSWSQMYW